MIQKLGPRGWVILVAFALAIGVALTWGLPDFPDDLTVDLRWARWVTIGMAFAGIGATFMLGKGKLTQVSRGTVVLCAFVLMQLGSLIPGLGGRTVDVYDAITLGFTALILSMIVIQNFQHAWKLKGDSSSTATTPPSTGPTA